MKTTSRKDVIEMRLGELLKTYLIEHNISQRAFARRCGLSSGYITMIVEERNPYTNAPIVPNIRTLNLIARGMGKSLDELVSEIDDTIVEINSKSKTDEFVELFTQLSDIQQDMIIASMKGIIHENYKW